MEEFIEKMASQVGIDKATAEKVVSFLKDHASEIPKLLSGGGDKDGGVMGQVQGALGGMFGGKKDD